MRKFLEIFLFIIISLFLGVAISVPLFLFSTQGVRLNLGILGEINIYKATVILLILIAVIFSIVRNITYKFRENKETRHYILRKYPLGISHIFIFFSQILPSIFPSWLRFFLILGLFLFGLPRLMGFWFTNTPIDPQIGSIPNLIANIILTQLIFAPISIIFVLNKYFDRKRMNEIDYVYQSSEDSNKPPIMYKANENTNNSNVPNNSKEQTEEAKPKFNTIQMLILRFIAYLIDLFLLVGIIVIFVIGLNIVLSLLTSGSLTQENLDKSVMFISVSFGIAHFIVMSIVQMLLLSRKGFTLGKLITGLRVKESSMNNITTQRAFYRELVFKLLSGLVYFSFIMYFFNREGKMLHDELMDTYIIKANK